MKKHIESVRVEKPVDESPDYSYLGKFTDDPSPEAFIRYGEHRGKQIKELEENDELPQRSRYIEYRFFLPAMTGEETGNPESPRQDWQRIESLMNNDWCFLGVIAKAVVVSSNGIVQTLRSGGLWGIESDSDKEHFDEVTAIQLSELRSELEDFGFGKRAIDYAFKNVKLE